MILTHKQQHVFFGSAFISFSILVLVLSFMLHTPQTFGEGILVLLFALVPACGISFCFTLFAGIVFLSVDFKINTGMEKQVVSVSQLSENIKKVIENEKVEEVSVFVSSDGDAAVCVSVKGKVSKHHPFNAGEYEEAVKTKINQYIASMYQGVASKTKFIFSY